MQFVLDRIFSVVSRFMFVPNAVKLVASFRKSALEIKQFFILDKMNYFRGTVTVFIAAKL